MKIYLMILTFLIVFTGCTQKEPKIIYIDKIKYVYLPNKDNKKQTKKLPKEKTATSPKKESNVIAKTKKNKEIIKYQEPNPTTIYAPKEFRKRENQKMNFMVGINNDKSKFLYMEGEFGKDTYKDFLEFKNSIDSQISEIKINSNGGFVLSAMKIGSFIKENSWSTGLDKEMHCFSACAFVYFAGKEKSIQGKAKIGLHRPYIKGIPDTPQSIRKIKREYLSYWRYIKAPMDLYYEMMEVNRDDLYIVDKDSLEDYIDVNIYK